MDRFSGFAKGLTNSWGKNFIFLDEVDSTNSYILRNDLEAGTVVAAACQTAGKGRGGRAWRSPSGSLAFSVALPSVSKKILSGLQILAAYATIDALIDYADIRVKWPNDLVCGEKKIAGILLETVFSGNTPSKLALGIGLNVNGAPTDIETAAYLSAYSHVIPSFGKIMADIVNSLNERFEEYIETEDIQSDWPHYSAFFGKKISFHHKGKLISATEKGISPEGYIIVEHNGIEEVYNDFSV
jgi:BirA family biotin operon repressor/biotin-[acetyl-CoA-carboxylase] ligase